MVKAIEARLMSEEAELTFLFKAIQSSAKDAEFCREIHGISNNGLRHLLILGYGIEILGENSNLKKKYLIKW